MCTRSMLLISFLGMVLTGLPDLTQQTQNVSLNAPDQLKLLNVKAETVTYKDRKTLRVVDAAPADSGDEGRLAIVPNTEFQDGDSEVEDSANFGILCASALGQNRRDAEDAEFRRGWCSD